MPIHPIEMLVFRGVINREETSAITAYEVKYWERKQGKTCLAVLKGKRGNFINLTCCNIRHLSIYITYFYQ